MDIENVINRQFNIAGNKRKFNFWTKILKIAQEKTKTNSDKSVNISSVFFATPYCLIVKYEFVNAMEKYELVFQGEYQEEYRYWKDSEEKRIPNSVEIETLIKIHHGKDNCIKR